MLVVMDMSTGKTEERLEPEFGSFEDEVLNAEWQQPIVPIVQLGLQPVVVRHDPAHDEAEVEIFLKNVYLSQE
jgi:hypothetical protein